MTNHSAAFNPGFILYEEGAFQRSSFLGAEDGLIDPSTNFIDPDLQASSPSSGPYIAKCDLPPQTVQRFLDDSQTTAFFNLGSNMRPNRALRQTGIPPAHAPVHAARFPSPTTSQEPSSAGSVLSPPADTDSYYEHNFPATPPETTLLTSPCLHSTSYDYMSQPSVLDFSNMGPSQFQPSGYVNPIDVQTGHHVYESEQTGLDFTLGASESFGYDYDPVPPFNSDQHQQQQHGQEAPVAEPGVRVSSPEANQPPVKEEIQATYNYPAPSQHEDDSGDDAAELDPSFGRSKGDDDSDYRPNLKRTRSNAGAGASTKSSTRRRSATTFQPAPADASPSKKRPRNVAPSTSVPTAARPSPSGPGMFPCPHCKHSHFKDQLSLENHVKKQHTRPYRCVFHFAGCGSTFATKNEWKRHVSSQHLLLQYWLCQEGACAKLTNNSSASSYAPGSRSRSRGGRAGASTVAATAGPSFGPPLPNGAIFNRKDLYTQHLRRMHTPPTIKKQAKQQQPRKTNNTNTTPDWEARLRALGSRAMQDRCALPAYMRCPAHGCEFEFRGPDAWDQRMEHVGRHLERAAAGKDPQVEFGGPHDPTLIEWASRADVAVIRRNAHNRWELNNPLRPTAKISGTGEMILTMPGALAGSSVVVKEEDEIVVEDLHARNDEYGDGDGEGEEEQAEDYDMDADRDAEGEMEDY